MPEFEGITVKLGGTEYVVPPLTIKQLRNGGLEKIRESDKFLTEGQSFESFMPRVEVIGMAIRRNHPEMTNDKLEDLIDLKNINPIWLAVLGISGLGAGGDDAAADPPQTLTTSGPPSGPDPGVSLDLAGGRSIDVWGGEGNNTGLEKSPAVGVLS